MFIKEIRIKNFKCIKDNEIEFTPGVNIIVGNNGVGKTTILEAISLILGGYTSCITGLKTNKK